MKRSTEKTTIRDAGRPFDLHLHSACSDGTDAPGDVVRRARENGLQLIALTDHDCIDGVQEAVDAGTALGVRVLPALEMDCEYPRELHILGLHIDPHNEALLDALRIARTRRNERNAAIFAQMKRAGYDIEPFVTPSGGTVTRLHIAKAIVDAGLAKDKHDAFVRYLQRGCVGYCAPQRFSPEAVISLIHDAGGQAVWAHPFHTTSEPHALARTLKAMGLAGIEAFHPSASEGMSEMLVSVARQNGLLVTCGSDYHGANRVESVPGQTWRDCAVLRETYAFFRGNDDR